MRKEDGHYNSWSSCLCYPSIRVQVECCHTSSASGNTKWLGTSMTLSQAFQFPRCRQRTHLNNKHSISPTPLYTREWLSVPNTPRLQQAAILRYLPLCYNLSPVHRLLHSAPLQSLLSKILFLFSKIFKSTSYMGLTAYSVESHLFMVWHRYIQRYPKRF